MSDDVEVSLQPRPRYGLMWHLAWALVTVGFVFLTAVFFMVRTNLLLNEIDQTGYMPASLPRVDVDDSVGVPLAYAAIVTGVFAPFLLAALIVGYRARWWWGPLLGVALGAANAGLWAALQPFRASSHDIVLVQFLWVIAGAVGGLLTAVRRQWGW